MKRRRKMDKILNERLEHQKEIENNVDTERTEMLQGMIFENHFMLRVLIENFGLKEKYKKAVDDYLAGEKDDLH